MISGPLSRKISRLPSLPDGLLDVDALAYIRQVESSLGARVALRKRNAISAFVKAEKAAGRWASIKRMYLPIWGVAAANAICMKSLTSGTWNGSVTHAAGYVQGDGSTGRLDDSQNSDTFWVSNLCFFGALLVTGYGGAGKRVIGVTDGTNVIYLGSAFSGNNSMGSNYLGSSNSNNSVNPTNYGIQTFSHDGTNNFLTLRKAGSVTRHSSNLTSLSQVKPARPISFLCFSAPGPIYSGYTSAVIGSIFIASGIGDEASTNAFTLNLKTLWETCTGLSLP